MDSLALLVVTIPIFSPGGKNGMGPLWFSLLLIVLASLGAITPPVGISGYVVSSLSGNPEDGTRVPPARVFRGTAAFLPAFGLCLAFMALLSRITWLPDVVRPLGE